MLLTLPVKSQESVSKCTYQLIHFQFPGDRLSSVGEILPLWGDVETSRSRLPPGQVERYWPHPGPLIPAMVVMFVCVMINALIEPHAALIDQCFFFLQWVLSGWCFFPSPGNLESRHILRPLMDAKAATQPEAFTQLHWNCLTSTFLFPLQMLLLRKSKVFFFFPSGPHLSF